MAYPLRALALAISLLGAPALASEPVQTTPGALSLDQLEGLAGGANDTAVAISSQNLEAVNTGAKITADEVVTGSISLNSSAMSGFSGVGNFTLNTGNNNNLQTTMSVTVVMPAGTP